MEAPRNKPSNDGARRSPSTAVLYLVIAAMVVLAYSYFEREWKREGAALFSAVQVGAPIFIAADASPEERTAAELLRATLAKAAGRDENAFPILSERTAAGRGGLFVGETAQGRAFGWRKSVAPFDNAVGVRVRGGRVVLRSERRAGIEVAAAWFLERNLGAHWFVPGPLGENVPRRTELRLAAGDEIARPGFVSRDFSGIAGGEGREWLARNRLESRFEHSHSLARIFSPADFRRAPEMAPMRAGQRYQPGGGDLNWQPDLTNPVAIRHAATAAVRAFTDRPSALSFSLGANDSLRFDDSPATLERVAPRRFFRGRPDYSDLVFGFTNAVAEAIRPAHPDKWITAYAYYWAENTPRFPIAPNVVPFLTADRSQWFDPEFATEDRALIERWCRSGAGVVGVYDYFYGAPFLVPRPTLYAVTQTIPFEYGAGVRAFHAEAFPNWALDGPKLWLAAQLLWSPQRKPEELLDLYYREFWAETAAPMREFFALCECAWLEQPRHRLWLRHYQDEDQVRLFPLDRRAALRAKLAEAARLARSAQTRARMEFISAGFDVSERFAEFCVAREAAGRLADTGASPAMLVEAWRSYRNARIAFVRRHEEVRAAHPLALAGQDLEIYLRNQPDGRVARALAGTAAGRRELEGSAALLKQAMTATPREIGQLFASSVECLHDSAWEAMEVRSPAGAADLEWTAPGQPWRGGGEPWESRSVMLNSGSDGKRRLRIENARTESLGQWVPVTENALYAARVKVRAKASPGTAVFLIVNFLDAEERHIDLGRVDRLSSGGGEQEVELCVISRAPAKARFVGYGLRVLNQTTGDLAEFAGASLTRLVE